MRVSGLCIAIVGWLVVAHPILLSAAAADDADICPRASALAEQRLAACTREIESGLLQGSDLATAYMNRGNARQDSPGHGMLAAIADYDAAIAIRERLRDTLGENWPVPWRNDLAVAYMNRGIAKYNAPGQGALKAIADYDAAIAIMERLREALGEDCPVSWRNDLAYTYMHRGNAKQTAHGHGVTAAIADYDLAIALMEPLRQALGEDWPVPWRNHLAAAHANRGIAKQHTPGYSQVAVIADYDAAIPIMEGLREALGEHCPVPWRNDLAAAYMNRGIAKQDAPGYGVLRAIADYDAAIAIRERLREALGEDWPLPWRNDLATAYMGRGIGKQDAPGHGMLAAIADYDAAIAIMEGLSEALGEECPVPWRNSLAFCYFSRGLAHLQLEDRATARADARQAESLWLDLGRVIGQGPWAALASSARDLRLAAGSAVAEEAASPDERGV